MQFVCSSHQHPRVRYAACNALGQLCTDFGPNCQKKFHQKVCSYTWSQCCVSCVYHVMCLSCVVCHLLHVMYCVSCVYHVLHVMCLSCVVRHVFIMEAIEVQWLSLGLLVQCSFNGFLKQKISSQKWWHFSSNLNGILQQPSSCYDGIFVLFWWWSPTILIVSQKNFLTAHQTIRP